MGVQLYYLIFLEPESQAGLKLLGSSDPLQVARTPGAYHCARLRS
jgi:hypothetical protein